MELSQTDYYEVRRAIHDLCGLAIGDDKQYLVKSRLQPVLEQNGLKSYAAMVQRLRQSEPLLLKDQIIEAITTNETSFNRDAHPFDALRRHILPELAERMLGRRKAGLLSVNEHEFGAAVATGQKRTASAWR
jgi:chemotaxis protein methyltransferase CheR